MVEKWISIYPFIKYVEGPRTGNAVDNWNNGLDHSSGDYAIVVHHDEWFARKDCLSSILSKISESDNSPIVFVGSEVVGAMRKSRFHLVNRWAGAFGFPRWTLYASNWIGPCAAFAFPRDTGIRFDPSLKSMVDVDFYARSTFGRSLIFIEDTLVFSGAHSEQITAKNDLHAINEEEIIALRKRGIDMTNRQYGVVKFIISLRRLISRLKPITPPGT